MTWYLFGESVWETISLFAIALFLIFYLIHYISHKKFAVFRILVALVVLLFAIIVLLKLGHIAPHYKMTGLVDLILVTAMAMIVFDFIVLFARACGVKVSNRFEVWLFWIIGLCYAAFGLLFLSMGSPAQFMQLDRITDVWLQPFWVLILIRWIFLSRGPNKKVDSV